jgi:hypothetical protein
VRRAASDAYDEWPIPPLSLAERGGGEGGGGHGITDDLNNAERPSPLTPLRKGEGDFGIASARKRGVDATGTGP